MRLIRALVSSLLLIGIWASPWLKPIHAFAAPNWSVDVRVAGDDRYGTAAALLAYYPQQNVSTVVLVSGESFADSLSASPLAAKLGAPLLLTRSGSLPDVTRRAIQRLQPNTIVIVGGLAAISDSVRRDLSQLGVATIIRLSGADRYETSAAVATYGWQAPVPRVFVVSGETFGPGMVAGPIAAAYGNPLVLTTSTHLPESVGRALVQLRAGDALVLDYGSGATKVDRDVNGRLWDVTTGYVIGNYAQDVVDLSNKWLRQLTNDRYLSNPFETSINGFVITSESFPDSLGVGALAGLTRRPVFLSGRSCVPETTDETIGMLKRTSVTIIGGAAALSAEVAQGALCSASSTSPPASSPNVTLPPNSTPSKRAYNPTCSVTFSSFTSSAKSPTFFLRLVADSSGTPPPSEILSSLFVTFSYSISRNTDLASYYGNGSITSLTSAFGGEALNGYFYTDPDRRQSTVEFSIVVTLSNGSKCSAKGSLFSY
ncbi:MAG: hypothetical protein FGM45_03125 [Actinobacteria bacterium]|nr:hypothetical protein [Actinomycetota bacterium]